MILEILAVLHLKQSLLEVEEPLEHEVGAVPAGHYVLPCEKMSKLKITIILTSASAQSLQGSISVGRRGGHCKS